MKLNKLYFLRTTLLSFFVLFFFGIFLTPKQAFAQYCSFRPVSPALTDLGTNQYWRMSNYSLPTIFTPTNYIGGLYPGGSNSRPPQHEAAGVAIANQIQPINGRIGLISVGMSNTSSEFSRFIQIANADPVKNDALVLINGAQSGGTIEQWLVTPISTNFYWTNMFQRVSQARLSRDQIQIIWLKITQGDNNNFPTNVQLFQSRLAQLVTMLKAEFPNLKITYLSSRTRSHGYSPSGISDPGAFENGFGVRWLIEDQINGNPALNYNPDLGQTPVPYLSWGPYLWIDGDNMRSDGRIWPVSYVMPDCFHPSTLGNQAVAEMLLEFFKSDTTTTPWFLDSGVPVPTPSPSPSVPPLPTPTPTPTPTPSPSIVPTPSPSSSPLPPGSPISKWSFGANVITDDINGCTGCTNLGATWFTPGIVSGAFSFNGTSAAANLGSFPFLNGASAFTVSVWINPEFNQTHTAWRSIFTDGSNVELFYLSNLNDWRANLRTTTGTYRVDTQNLTWEANVWHQMVLTYDGSQMQLYWDGVLMGSKAATGNVYADSGATYLGRPAVSTNYFLGAIDELSIYNYALSASEVLSSYSNP